MRGEGGGGEGGHRKYINLVLIKKIPYLNDVHLSDLILDTSNVSCKTLETAPYPFFIPLISW